MTIGLKTWKFRDIRSPSPLAYGLAALLCLTHASAHASDCADVEPINVPGAKLQQFYRDCRSQFLEPLKSAGKGVSFERVEPETQCRHNLEAGHNRTGYRADFSVPLNIPGVEEPQFNAASSAPKDGACQYTWTAMKTAYCGLKKRRQLACNATAQQLQKFSRCLEDDSAEKCYENFQSILAQYDSLSTQTQSDLRNAERYVTHLKGNSEQVFAKYQQDANSLSRPIPPEERTQPSLHGVAAEKGGFTQIGDYRQHLVGAATRGPLQGQLPVEQQKAMETANSFVSVVKDLANKQNEWLQRVSQTYRNKSPDKDKKDGSALATAGQLAGPAAGAGQALMGGTTAASGASGALPLAAAALAGAGALSGTTGGSSAKGSAFGDMPATGASAAAAAAAAATNSPTTEKFAAANASPTSTPTAAFAAVKNESEASALPTNAGATNANANLGSAATGASLQGKAGPRAAGRKLGSVESAGGDEMLTPFGGDLNRSPGPKRNEGAAAGGGDISNLLGQMKNLFNFDDPLANAPSAGVFPGTHPGGENFENYGGGEEAYAGDQYAEANGGEYGADDSMGSQGSPFGTINVSLFERVQLRHQLCIKRGLVMRKMEELPQ